MPDFSMLKALLLFTIISSLLPSYAIAASSPPPPPPPCQIQSAGCYRAGDIKAGFGELDPSEFAYYLSESKCKNTGSCSCGSVSDTIPQETDPDGSGGACACIAGTDWNPKGRCCGDDAGDCGTISPSGILCNIDQAGKAKWIVPSESKGRITYIGCSDTEYLSDGLKLIKCDGTFWKIPVTIGGNTHEYVCIGSGMNSIVECCGDGFCNSNDGGQRRTTGGSVQTCSDGTSHSQCSANKPLYCDSGALVNRASQCGCPSGATAQGDNCTASASVLCSDGTSHSQCSANKPLYCDSGALVNRASQCGCPSGTIAQGDNCASSAIRDELCARKIALEDSYIGSNYDSQDPKEYVVIDEYNQIRQQLGLQLIPLDPPDRYYDIPDYKQCPAGATSSITSSVVYNSQNKITGRAVAGEGGTTHYCTSDGKFVTDLDVPNSQIKNIPLINRNKATCKGAGLTWTGTKCCSENDDEDEYYNDPNGTGGCWGSEPVVSIDFAGVTDNSVINYKGEFHGCAIDKSIFNENNDYVLTLADQHTSNALVTNHNYCFADPGNSYYCSYTEKWLPTKGIVKTHLSFSPLSSAPNTTQFAECCSQTQCWNGTVCIGNQLANPSSPPTNGSRCINGEWLPAEKKDCPDGRPCGFCSISSQCISDIPKGTPLHCIEPDTYIDDNFCDNGTWTTRTMLVASTLLGLKDSMTGGDYTLFCDNKENTLNKLQYLTSTNDAVLSLITDLNTNNFCVLQTSGKIVIGSSLNKDFELVLPKTLNLFGIKNCNSGLAADGRYHSCDLTNKVWNNKKLKSIIFSPSAIVVPQQQDPSWTAEFTAFIKNQIRDVIEAIKRLVQQPPYDESYSIGLKRFDRLYMTQQGSKSIIGSVEGTSFKNMVIRYSGFEDDICGFVESYDRAIKDFASGITCQKEGNQYYVLAQGTQFTNINPQAIFLDLTSKLRLK
ncbi:hypothetical protein HYW20_01525 [Candidatus Woesearchaeota archaeon]|nr:hypothetical protein [Candidatus Woesearchaeota archaeon]